MYCVHAGVHIHVHALPETMHKHVTLVPLKWNSESNKVHVYDNTLVQLKLLGQSKACHSFSIQTLHILISIYMVLNIYLQHGMSFH